MSWLLLGLGSAGCVDTLKLPPARTHEVVKSGDSRQRIIWYRGRRYPIRADNDAELRVTAWRFAARPAGKSTDPADEQAPKPRREKIVAPLGAVTAQGDTLYFPNAAPARACELDTAEIEIRGEPLAPLPSWTATEGDVPLAKRKHFYGFQLGGTSFAQLIFRARAVGPLYLDVGAGGLAIPGVLAANASLGFVVEAPLERRWSVYTGAGVGGGLAIGAGGGLATRYLYGRVGLAVRVGVEQRDQVGVDGGFWRGISSDDGERAFMHPMLGFFWLRAF